MYPTEEMAADLIDSLSRPILTENSTSNLQQVIFVGGVSGVVCCCLCIVIFMLELVCLFQKKCTLLLGYRRMNKFILRYFVYMTFACILFTGTRSLYLIHFYIYNDQSDEVFCKVFGFLNCNVKLMILFFMTVLIVLVLFNAFGCLKTPKSLKPCLSSKQSYLFLEFTFIVFIFSSPLFVCWIPFTTNHYGEEGPYCWIKKTYPINESELGRIGTIEEIFLWFVPLYAAAAIGGLCVLLIAVRLCWLLVCKRKILTDKKSIVIKESCLLLALFITALCVFSTVLIVYHILQQPLIDLVLTPIPGVSISLTSCFYILITVAVHQRRAGYLLLRNSPGQPSTANCETAPPSTRISLPSRTSQHAPCFLSPSEA